MPDVSVKRKEEWQRRLTPHANVTELTVETLELKRDQPNTACA